MSGKSASLLTKTQRRRIENGFDELTEEKKRRDQQRIRERLRSGVRDFRLLADYPDGQLEMAFEDEPDDDLRAALADATVVLERVRELRGYDRNDVLGRARDRAREVASSASDARSLDRVDLRTPAEIRRQTEAAVEEQYGSSPWEARARWLFALGGTALALPFLMVVADEFAGTDLVRSFNNVAGLLVLVGIGCLAGWLLVTAAHVLKHDVVPAMVAFLADPGGAVREAWKDL